jgi:hypothetical protein
MLGPTIQHLVTDARHLCTAVCLGLCVCVCVCVFVCVYVCMYVCMYIDEFVKEANVKIYISSRVRPYSFVDLYRRFDVTCSIYVISYIFVTSARNSYCANLWLKYGRLDIPETAYFP